MPNLKRTSNRLAEEKSPYLLQHANNPVDWYPWCDEAFKKAEEENKPIFLSVGYSTCHWCHVMEGESFEDVEVAKVLNEHFISIKVDREERPDIDNIYMSVCQAMTGQGGWPLTVIMTPKKEPFFAGTYFPKKSKWGRPGLIELLLQIVELWKEDPGRLHDISKKIMQALNDHVENFQEGEPTKELLQDAYRELKGGFDHRYGGFGGAPKFPTPHNLLFLIRYSDAFGEKNALEMAEKTLESMYRGGIYDHLGFGFSRYSTDEKWLVPHFEKMLYDNALLAYTYLEAYQARKKPFYEQVVREIFAYILRDMTSPEGAFYSAEDADSEGVEGKFYVWTPEEVLDILGGELGEKVCKFYNLTVPGNFEGKNILNRLQSKGSSDLSARSREVEDARQRLFQEREKRVHPHKDDKVLTGWNGLMIAALAKATQVLGDDSFADSAEKAVGFIRQHLCREDGRLLARYRDGQSNFLAYAEDYSFLIWGLIELYQASWNVRHLSWALSLQKDLTDLFWDKESGGFYFYGKDGEKLIARNKEIYDGATPSANSVAALNALRLARLTGEDWLDDQAESLLRTFSGRIEGHPSSSTFFLLAVDFALGDSQEIVVSSPSNGITDTLREFYLPRSVTMGYRSLAQYEELEKIAPAVRGKYVGGEKTKVFVCRNFECQAPVEEPEKLREMLGRKH